MAEPSIRESLVAAQQSLSAPAEPSTSAPEPVDPETPPEHAPEGPEDVKDDAPAQPARARDEAGRFTRGIPEQAVPGGKKPTEQKAAGAQGDTKTPTPTAGTAAAQGEPPELAKPPASWKPATREHWAKLPTDVRQEVARREREVAQALEKSAQHRRAAEGFERMLQPYRAFMTGEPTQVLDGLLRTAVQLQTAPPAGKAAIVAEIIRGYGVDIETLAGILEGQPQGARPQAQPTPQEFRDPRFDQFLGQLQQAQQHRSAAARSSAEAEVQRFAETAEFYEDVREDMADAMALARQRGRPLTLQEAYERACALNPDVRPLWEQRQAAKAAANAQASTQRARAAASSVRHEPTAPSTSAEPTSLRGALQAAWTSSQRR